MYDSESDESDKPRCSDDESGHLGQSQSESNESEKQMLDTEYIPSVKHSQLSVTCITGGNIALAASSRSAHTQGNRVYHATSEEAGAFNGGKFIETPNLTSPTPLRNTPPTLTCQRSWVMGRRRGRTRVEETKISTSVSHDSYANLTDFFRKNTDRL